MSLFSFSRGKKNQGQTLINAAKNDNIAEVERLLKAGVPVDSKDSVRSFL